MSIPQKVTARARHPNRIPGTRMIFTYSVVQCGTERRNCDLKKKSDLIVSIQNHGKSICAGLVQGCRLGVKRPVRPVRCLEVVYFSFTFLARKKEFVQFPPPQSRTHDQTFHIPVANHYTIVTPTPEVTTTTKYPPPFFFEKNQVSYSSLYNLIFPEVTTTTKYPPSFFLKKTR